MILVADIGNSRTTIALVEGRTTAASVGSPTARLNFRRTIALIRDLAGGARDGGIAGAAIASVVPTHTTLMANAIQEACGVEAVVVSAGTAGIKTTYDDPAAIGADRLCNAVAAHALTGAGAIVIDCGTAVTIDCVDAAGTFLGGAILPGFRTAVRALHDGTAQLPEIPLEPPATAMGTSTVTNLQSGIVLGTTYAIDGIVRRIMEESFANANVPVIVTGGHAAVYRTVTSLETLHEPDLVLIGAAMIGARN